MFTILSVGLLGLVLVAVALTVSPAWQSPLFRRTANGKQFEFNKGLATEIDDDETLFALTDEIGAALVICDENGKPDMQATNDALMEITAGKIDNAEKTNKPANLRSHQVAALQAIQAGEGKLVDDDDDEDEDEDPQLDQETEETENSEVEADVDLSDDSAVEDEFVDPSDSQLPDPDALLQTPLELVFPEKADQQSVKLDALKAAGVNKITDAFNHADLTKIAGINKKTKNRIISRITGYLKTAQETVPINESPSDPAQESNGNPETDPPSDPAQA